MGAREDFMTMRRAAQYAERTRGPGHPIQGCLAALLAKASVNEMSFIALSKRAFYPEVIDLAYAVLGEERPGGPAVEPDA